ncbi:hypothetical protein [Lentilactobacillus laojiaonis]|uniref:hypothetical protein n=1 Tax=Lentilactobacillus laojiaonis TaxID=2883998 RepID=UPI001D0BE070|nr:hypothetical protein [Lentilactobacillus laojiaonis]UDM32218.1 hypothetical protein LHL71_00320 [Lentilactobacillus laojiaonis]
MKNMLINKLFGNISSSFDIAALNLNSLILIILGIAIILVLISLLRLWLNKKVDIQSPGTKNYVINLTTDNSTLKILQITSFLANRK